MSEQNKAIARRFYAEAFSLGKQSVSDELLTADCVDHNPPGPGLASGREGIKQVIGMFRSAYPDLNLTVDDQIAEGDKVVSRLTARGTHKGALMDIPPTGKTATVGIVDILRFDRGKIVERWGQADMLGMMQQLGVVPPPG